MGAEYDGTTMRRRKARSISGPSSSPSFHDFHPLVLSAPAAAALSFVAGMSLTYATLRGIYGGGGGGGGGGAGGIATLRVASSSSLSSATSDLHPDRSWASPISPSGAGGGCLISSFGEDGIGHQMEAKFSCLGAAAFYPDLTYVHTPMSVAENGVSATQAEDYFNMGGAIGALNGGTAAVSAVPFDPSQMETAPRNPLPWVGQCDKPSWFDEGTRIEACSNSAIAGGGSKRTVYTSDNCWDAFWCRLAHLPHESAETWHRSVALALRAAHRSSIDLDAAGQWPRGELTVALHVRQGDAGYRQARVALFKEVVDGLRGAAAGLGMPIRFVVHTDGEVDVVARKLGTVGSDDVTIFGKEFDMTMAIHQMTKADIFVSSWSSLSHVVGLLRDTSNQNGGPEHVLYPFNRERIGSVSLGWKVMNVVENRQDDDGKIRTAIYLMGHPEKGMSVNADRGDWKRIGEDYWRDLLVEKKSI